MKDRNKIMRFFGLHPQNDVRRKFAFTLAEGATHVDNSNNKRKFAFTLAEGATHVGNSNNKCKFAFTLAEVLVTLGIIGVVAVLTVPNIISSYQKKVYVTQLQKGYSQLQQVFDLAMADDEVEYIADTELIQSINGDFIIDSDQSAFSSKLGEYLKIQKVCQPEDFSDGCHNITYQNLNGDAVSERGGDLQVFTKDGAIYYFFAHNGKTFPDIDPSECERIKLDGGSLCGWQGTVHIDVNGIKKPNKYGRDFFRFGFDIKGQLFPAGSFIEGKEHSYLEYSDRSCDLDPVYGVGCAAKIMDDGWVMDY